jgi:CheY-like chemotaxis protein
MEPLDTTAMMFSTVSSRRIEDACGFVADLPRMCRGELARVDLGYRRSARLLVVLARTQGAGDAGRRIAFWCGVVGGRGRRFADMSDEGRAAHLRVMEGCDRRIEAVPPALLAEAVRSLASELGWGAFPPRREAMPCLDLDRPESHDGVRYESASGTLFVPATPALPLGDALPILVRGSGASGVVVTRVLEHVTPGQEGRGRPGGFRARIVEAPQEAIRLLAAWEHRSEGRRRSAPRYAYRAPVVARPISEPSEPEPALGSEMELTNISQGGAQIRTRSAPRPGARLELEFALPSGERIAVDARVMWSDAAGMGVKFEAEPEQEALIGNGLALLSGRPRRALVIDDDALSREIVGDALAERGYEVLKAVDGAAGLRMLTDELLSLDAVVTDLAMPNMDGEAFVEAVRRAGGERDLAIVVATGTDDPFARSRLEATGVDAVIEKRLGGGTIASAVESAVKARSGAPSTQ